MYFLGVTILTTLWLYQQWTYGPVLCNIYVFLMQWKHKRLTSIVFDMAHSGKTLIVFLHKQIHPVSDCWHLMLSKHLAPALILSALSWIVCLLLWASLTVWHMSTILLPLFHLDYSRWCTFMFLIHIGNKYQCCPRGNWMSYMIVSQM